MSTDRVTKNITKTDDEIYQKMQAFRHKNAKKFHEKGVVEKTPTKKNQNGAKMEPKVIQKQHKQKQQKTQLKNDIEKQWKNYAKWEPK